MGDVGVLTIGKGKMVKEMAKRSRLVEETEAHVLV
jgi:GH24 family phage-related lysozyme (muramidase)